MLYWQLTDTFLRQKVYTKCWLQVYQWKVQWKEKVLKKGLQETQIAAALKIQNRPKWINNILLLIYVFLHFNVYNIMLPPPKCFQ